MASSVLTRQEFAARLAQEASAGEDPVIVLENGAPAHVWLSYDAYESMKHLERVPLSGFGKERSLADVFDHPAFDGDVDDFEIPRLDFKLEGVDLGPCS